jgi:hypothetical protein
MRNAGAEWGYTGFGREPGRAASLIFVACAVGAIGGAGAVFSLVAQPGSETSIGSAHPLGSVVARAAAHSPVKEAALPSRPRLASTVSGSQEQIPSHVAVTDEGIVTPTTDGSGSATVEPTAVPPERSTTTQHDTVKAPAPAAPSQPSTEAPPAEKKASRKPAYVSRYAWGDGYSENGRLRGMFVERGSDSRQ